MTNEILEAIITETNRYYHQQTANKPPRIKWKDVTKKMLNRVTIAT